MAVTLSTEYQLIAQKWLGNSGGDVYIRAYAKYSSQDVINNKTLGVTVQLRVYYSGTWIACGAWSFSGWGDYYTSQQAVNTNGDIVFVSHSSASYDFGNGETIIGTSAAIDVAHSSTGTKSIIIGCWGSFTSWGWQGSSGNVSANLPTIDRSGPTVSFSASNISTDSFNITITSNEAVAYGSGVKPFRYSIDNGSYVYGAAVTTSGVKSQTISVTGRSPGVTYSVRAEALRGYNNVWGSSTQSITTLSKSTLDSASNVTLSSSTKGTFTFKPVYSNHKYKLVLTCGTLSYTIPTSGYISAGTVGQTQTEYFTTTCKSGGTNVMTIARWAKFIPTQTGTITARLDTYDVNGNLLGSSSRTLTATVPSDSTTRPSVSTPTLTDGNNALYTVFGKGSQSSNNFYINGFSTLRAALSISRGETSSTGLKYNATLKSVKLEVGSGSTVGSNILSTTTTSTSSGTSTVTATVMSPVLNPTIAVGTQSADMWYRVTITDSRNYTGSTENTFTIWNYWSPSGTISYEISNDVRGDSSNVLGIKVYTKWSIASLNNNNDKYVTITRQKGTTSTTHTPDITINYIQSSDYIWAQELSDANMTTYLYTLKVQDAANFNEFVTSTGVVCISRHRGGRGVTLFADASSTEISSGGLWANSIRLDLTTSEYTTLASLLAETYKTTTVYSLGDFCKYTVSGTVHTYEYINNTSASNKTPTNTSYWAQLV